MREEESGDLNQNKRWKWEVGTGGGRSAKEYFVDLYNIDNKEQVSVHMCGFDGLRFEGPRFEGP